VYFVSSSNISSLIQSKFQGKCDEGEILDCLGACLTASNCEKSSTGLTNCIDWLSNGICNNNDNLVMSDDGTYPDFSCSMYSNDYGDCDCTTDSCSDDLTVEDVIFVSWSSVVTVIVTGQDDDDIDGAVPFTVDIGPSTSSNQLYEGITYQLKFLNHDDDNIVTLSTTECDISESGDYCSFVITYSLDNPSLEAVFVQAIPQSFEYLSLSLEHIMSHGSGSTEIVATSIDNDLDDSDRTVHVDIKVNISYTRTQKEILTKDISSSLGLSISVAIRDDDTAGLVVLQDGVEWYQLKYYREDSDHSFSDYPYYDMWVLPHNLTYESSKALNSSFSLMLTTAPEYPVKITVSSAEVNPNGGEPRFEGIPVYETSESDSQGSAYHYTTNSYWVNSVHLSDIDTVENKDGHVSIVLDESNYTDQQMITVIGLDDAVDDYSVEYNVTIRFTSKDLNYDGLQLNLVFNNVDDDEAGWVAFVEDNEDTCSEPYYGKTAFINIYLTSEPKSSVLLFLTSSDASEAGPNDALLSIDKYTWDVVHTISVSSKDDAAEDGDIPFNVTVSVVLSDDPEYGSIDVNPDGMAGLYGHSVTMAFLSLDDPDDAVVGACGAGEYGAFPDCTACPPGQYAEEFGDKVSCRFCPPGTFGTISGAEAMIISTDIDGNVNDPGCMPCLSGTYSQIWGATSCEECPDGYFCNSLASTHPFKVNGTSSVVEHGWEQLEAGEWESSMVIFGKRFHVNAERYQAMCTVLIITFTIFISVLGLSLHSRVHSKFKDFVVMKLKKFDKFSEEHLDIEGEATVLGGVLSLSALALSGVFIILYLYTYWSFNEHVENSFTPLDQSFYTNIGIELETQISFVGYSGCVGDDLLTDADPSIAINYLDGRVSYQCERGSLVVSFWTKKPQTLSQGPSIEISLEPPCPSCTEDANSLLVCSNCTIASVQSIEWSVVVPAIYPGDTNTVFGRTVPSSSQAVFRGSTATTVEVSLIPTSMEDLTDGYYNEAFRVQFSDTSYGSTALFSVNQTAQQMGSGNLLSNYIIETEFVNENVDNMVSFRLELPIFSLRLKIIVDYIASWLDLWGLVGGITATIFGFALMVMLKFESLKDPEHHGRKALQKARRAMDVVSKAIPSPSTPNCSWPGSRNGSPKTKMRRTPDSSRPGSRIDTPRVKIGSLVPSLDNSRAQSRSSFVTEMGVPSLVPNLEDSITQSRSSFVVEMGVPSLDNSRTQREEGSVSSQDTDNASSLKNSIAKRLFDETILQRRPSHESIAEDHGSGLPTYGEILNPAALELEGFQSYTHNVNPQRVTK